MAKGTRRLALSPPAGARLSVGLVDGIPHLVVSVAAPATRLPHGLTEAETSIAHLLLAGATNAEIAHARGSSIATVSKQVSSLFRKVGVQSRSELVASLVSTAARAGTGAAQERAVRKRSARQALRVGTAPDSEARCQAAAPPSSKT
jgi:DNA-binding CsgD family transcriptional regulator